MTIENILIMESPRTLKYGLFRAPEFPRKSLRIGTVLSPGYDAAHVVISVTYNGAQRT